MIKMKLQKIVAVCSLVGLSITQAWAEDLKDIYELALINDPTFKAAEASFRAGKEYNCLLYTTPSPRDGLLSRMPSSA